MSGKRSFSYEQLINGEVSQTQLHELIKDDKLDKATISRLLHIGRFLAKLESSVPDRDLPVRDVLTSEEVRAIWSETLDRDGDVCRRPILN